VAQGRSREWRSQSTASPLPPAWAGLGSRGFFLGQAECVLGADLEVGVLASAAERARLNVTRAIRAAIARIAQWDEPAGRALEQDISTGCYCSYEPKQGSGVRWRTERSSVPA